VAIFLAEAGEMHEKWRHFWEKWEIHMRSRHFWEKWEIHMRSRDISGRSRRYT
jgi:hypothetical protein